jgi:hypothetical protein
MADGGRNSSKERAADQKPVVTNDARSYVPHGIREQQLGEWPTGKAERPQ